MVRAVRQGVRVRRVVAGVLVAGAVVAISGCAGGGVIRAAPESVTASAVPRPTPSRTSPARPASTAVVSPGGSATRPVGLVDARPATTAPPAAALTPASEVTTYPNCAALNADHPHGVGRPGAVDMANGKPKAKQPKSSWWTMPCTRPTRGATVTATGSLASAETPRGNALRASVNGGTPRRPGWPMARREHRRRRARARP